MGGGKLKYENNELLINGTIIATSGTIGGYTINEHTLVGKSVGISSKSGYGWAFWAGSDTPHEAAFRVGHQGELYTNNATITNGLFLTKGRSILEEEVEGLYVGIEGLDYCWKKKNEYVEDQIDIFHLRCSSKDGFSILINGAPVMWVNGQGRAYGMSVGTHIAVSTLVASRITTPSGQ